jgi:two-component system, cell cycle response regulator
LKILVAEDDCITRRLLEARLTQWGHEVVACADGAEAWEILSSNDAPNLVILDWIMPEIDGVTLCREIRKIGRQPYTYVILLTAKTRKEDVIEGLESGADDYIVKPFDAHELQVRVRAGSRIVHLQQGLVSALAASEYQASHDPLTGLWNRKAVMDALNRELLRSDRENTNVGIIMGDVDHFKRINDVYGHLAGDAVLRELAARMLSAVRPYDTVGRYGGEEFLLVSPGCSGPCPQDVAERLRQSLAERPLMTPEGIFPVTMSFGVASVQGTGQWDTDAVVRGVDQALYRAKELGRNRVQVWRSLDAEAGSGVHREAGTVSPEEWIQ